MRGCVRVRVRLCAAWVGVGAFLCPRDACACPRVMRAYARTCARVHARLRARVRVRPRVRAYACACVRVRAYACACVRAGAPRRALAMMPLAQLPGPLRGQRRHPSKACRKILQEILTSLPRSSGDQYNGTRRRKEQQHASLFLQQCWFRNDPTAVTNSHMLRISQG